MKQVEFISDNKRLKGVLFFPHNLQNKNPAILFIHGWTSHKERSYQYAEALAKIGYISLVFDMRGHGESEGDINTSTTEDFLKDDMTAYDYLTKVAGVDLDNISAVGSSLGGHLVALLTAKRKIKNAVLRAPADYPNEVYDKPKSQFSRDDSKIMEWRHQARKPKETFALQALNNFDGNVLIIESEKDDRIPHTIIENYMNAVKDKSKLTHIVVKDAPHSIAAGRFRDEVIRILVDWFKVELS